MTPEPQVDARKSWARPYIAADRDAPAYGTPEWLALPDGPTKIAAVVRAAECWATDGDNLEANLTAELDAAAAFAAKTAADETFVRRRDAHRLEWSRKSWRPHPANRRPRGDAA